MKTSIKLALVLLMFQSSYTYAYQITAKDTSGRVFKSGEVVEDSNRYQVIYNVDEAKKTLAAKKETNLKTGEEFTGSAVYEIVDQPTIEQFKLGNSLKAIRFNPTIATIETISFSKGEYNYTKTTEAYVNLYHGTYEIDF